MIHLRLFVNVPTVWETSQQMINGSPAESRTSVPDMSNKHATACAKYDFEIAFANDRGFGGVAFAGTWI